MASHAAGRKYNVTSGEGGEKEKALAIHGNWQFKYAVPKVSAGKSLSPGYQMESKVSRQFRTGWWDPFFLSRNCVLERRLFPSGSTSGHGIYKALMQIIRQRYSNLRTLCIMYTYIHIT
jgi:hypothetical protein